MSTGKRFFILQRTTPGNVGWRRNRFPDEKRQDPGPLYTLNPAMAARTKDYETAKKACLPGEKVVVFFPQRVEDVTEPVQDEDNA